MERDKGRASLVKTAARPDLGTRIQTASIRATGRRDVGREGNGEKLLYGFATRSADRRIRPNLD